MKQKIVKKATFEQDKSPKTKKTKDSKTNKQSLYIKILFTLLVILTLCFFAYFLANKDSTKTVNSTQKIEKKDGTQKTIDDINRYLEKQDKNSQKFLHNQNTSVKKESQTVTKMQEKELTKVKSGEIKNVKNDLNSTLNTLNQKKMDGNLSVENNKTFFKQVEINATKSQYEIQVFEQNITRQNIKKLKNQPNKKDEKPLKNNELKGKVSTHESEISVSGGAKLVIIIDDVATFQHANAIKSVELKITPSIFPATKFHPDTPQIAKKFSFYMVHLPMQAIGNSPEEIGTLKVGDSIEKIQKTLRSIKKDFPNLKYMNNHTGSRFTSDFNSMDMFMSVAKRENLTFIDSKTINTTKVYEAAKKHGMRYIARDVFLDNNDSKIAIASQLKYAVKLAKQRGYAIAIGHPHKNTIDVLKNAKDILKGVEVVYLKEIL